MTQSRKRALVIFAALALFVLAMYISSVVDNKVKFTRFTRPLFDCNIPENTNKMRQIAHFVEETGQMYAALIISSDLSEQELSDFYQTNVVNTMSSNEAKIEFSIDQVKESDLAFFGSLGRYDFDQTYGDSQSKAIFVIVLSNR